MSPSHLPPAKGMGRQGTGATAQGGMQPLAPTLGHGKGHPQISHSLSVLTPPHLLAVIPRVRSEVRDNTELEVKC